MQRWKKGLVFTGGKKRWYNITPPNRISPLCLLTGMDGKSGVRAFIERLHAIFFRLLKFLSNYISLSLYPEWFSRIFSNFQYIFTNKVKKHLLYWLILNYQWYPNHTRNIKKSIMQQIAAKYVFFDWALCVKVVIIPILMWIFLCLHIAVLHLFITNICVYFTLKLSGILFRCLIICCAVLESWSLSPNWIIRGNYWSWQHISVADGTSISKSS